MQGGEIKETPATGPKPTLWLAFASLYADEAESGEGDPEEGSARLRMGEAHLLRTLLIMRECSDTLFKVAVEV